MDKLSAGLIIVNIAIGSYLFAVNSGMNEQEAAMAQIRTDVANLSKQLSELEKKEDDRHLGTGRNLETIVQEHEQKLQLIHGTLNKLYPKLIGIRLN